MAYDPFDDLQDALSNKTRTSTKRMIEALMSRAGQPNPSLGGALGHGLALGLMGLIEKRETDENADTALGVAKSRVGASGGLSSPMGSSVPSALPGRLRGDTDTATPPVAGGPSEMDMAANDVADSLAATHGMKLSPEAVARLAQVESGGNPRATTGKYAGATQMGADTFKEAGGRLGGLTYPEYKNGSLTQQMWAYPDWLQQYKTPDKLRQAGVDTASLSPAMQYGVLQANQFAPNGSDASTPPPWMAALGQGNPNVPSTPTPQARELGDKSVGQMAQASQLPTTPNINAAEDKRIQDYIAEGHRFEALGGRENKLKAAAFFRAAGNMQDARMNRELDMRNKLQFEREKQPIETEGAVARETALGPIRTQNDVARETALGPVQNRNAADKVWATLPADVEKTRQERAITMPPAWSDINWQQAARNAGEQKRQEVTASKEAEKEVANRYGAPSQSANHGVLRETAGKVIKQIDDSPTMGGPWARSLLSGVPGSTAADIQQNLGTIKSVMTIDELRQMRQASPTGGAVGNVSNYEDMMLARAKGSLEGQQSSQQLKYNLQRLVRVTDAIAKGQGKTPEEQDKFVKEAFGPESGVNEDGTVNAKDYFGKR